MANGQTFGDNFVKLCKTFAGIRAEPMPPELPLDAQGVPKQDTIERDINDARAMLPQAYDAAFIEPLLKHLPALVADYPKSKTNQRRLEALVGAVTQHNAGDARRAQLRRFLALVSFLYTSFLEKRADTGLGGGKIDEALPPLATFKYSEEKRVEDSPFTFSVDDVRRHIGAPVGVVSLPLAYAPHPVLWTWIAHETGGHNVVHAVPGLLEALERGVREELSGMSVPGLWPGQLGLLWSYWMNEAVADVYAVLNVGPMFSAGISAATAALRSVEGLEIPNVSMESPSADPHPTDILRIHLALGAVENLVSLRPERQSAYVRMLETIAGLCASGDVVSLFGYPLYGGHRVNAVVPLQEMQESARLVGRYVVTAALPALGNGSIQRVETWDDKDDDGAAAVRDALAVPSEIGAAANDAQLLAGALMYLLGNPEGYKDVTDRLIRGFDRSVDSDRKWGKAGGAPVPSQPRPAPSPELKAAPAPSPTT